MTAPSAKRPFIAYAAKVRLPPKVTDVPRPAGVSFRPIADLRAHRSEWLLRAQCRPQRSTFIVARPQPTLSLHLSAGRRLRHPDRHLERHP